MQCARKRLRRNLDHRRVTAALLWLSAGMAGSAYADAGSSEAVYGIWATSGTMIEVTPAGEDGLSAKIIALKNPYWREKDGVGVIGEPKTDLHNPDPALHSRPLVGLEILDGYEFRGGRWQGKLYLPSNGTTWKSAARVRNGELRIRGFIGLSLFGKTQRFTPIAACSEDILRMIRNAELQNTPCADKLGQVE